MTTTVYDVDLKTWDGQDNFLEKYKGKVTLFINVTGYCGNAPQFGIIEEIYQMYKDQGFEVVAIPTNDYCGPGITYGRYQDGIANAADAREYGQKVFDVTYDFSELVVSKFGLFDWGKKQDPNRIPHEIYEKLTESTSHRLMFGNFEKFLVDQNGRVAQRYANGTLLDYAYLNKVPDVNHPDVDFKTLCDDIEKLLAGERLENDLRYSN